MNELALFAGAGGGILGGHLLGWRTVCAVEIEDYPRRVLLQRQADGFLPRFPIWDDVCTFDGKPWRGKVDVISGGFPCQDISIAGGGEDLTAKDQVCGAKWRGSFTKYDPVTSLWKTHQCSLLGDLDVFSETWPQWGLMRDGECWEQKTLVQTTNVNEFGLLESDRWPTPDANMGKRGYQNPEKLNQTTHQLSVNDIAMKRYGIKKLNPQLCEWLMGWPLEWTDLNPLGTDKFHLWQQQHGNF